MTDLILVSAHWICGICVWGERLEIASGKGEHGNIPLLSPHPAMAPSHPSPASESRPGQSCVQESSTSARGVH